MVKVCWLGWWVQIVQELVSAENLTRSHGQVQPPTRPKQIKQAQPRILSSWQSDFWGHLAGPGCDASCMVRRLGEKCSLAAGCIGCPILRPPSFEPHLPPLEPRAACLESAGPVRQTMQISKRMVLLVKHTELDSSFMSWHGMLEGCSVQQLSGPRHALIIRITALPS